LFPAIIRLATDADDIARQLFEPIFLQMIHWFTMNPNSDNAETNHLLDAIVDGVGNPNNGAIRDYTARCLSEFFSSSIKHTGITTVS
jgi:DNA-dependent protein kinase catalytic subunit